MREKMFVKSFHCFILLLIITFWSQLISSMSLSEEISAKRKLVTIDLSNWLSPLTVEVPNALSSLFKSASNDNILKNNRQQNYQQKNIANYGLAFNNPIGFKSNMNFGYQPMAQNFDNYHTSSSDSGYSINGNHFFNPVNNFLDSNINKYYENNFKNNENFRINGIPINNSAFDSEFNDIDLGIPEYSDPYVDNYQQLPNIGSVNFYDQQLKTFFPPTINADNNHLFENLENAEFFNNRFKSPFFENGLRINYENNRFNGWRDREIPLGSGYKHTSNRIMKNWKKKGAQNNRPYFASAVKANYGYRLNKTKDGFNEEKNFNDENYIKSAENNLLANNSSVKDSNFLQNLNSTTDQPITELPNSQFKYSPKVEINNTSIDWKPIAGPTVAVKKLTLNELNPASSMNSLAMNDVPDHYHYFRFGESQNVLSYLPSHPQPLPQPMPQPMAQVMNNPKPVTNRIKEFFRKLLY